MTDIGYPATPGLAGTLRRFVAGLRAQERQPKPLTSLGFSQANMETAMCLWEAALELRDRLPALSEEWEEAGTVAMRHAIIALVHECEACWEAARAQDTELVPYDWEHCPAFLIERYGPMVEA